MIKETNDSPTLNSLVYERKLAFANLVRAFLKFNVKSARTIDVIMTKDNDVNIMINETLFKFDVADYTGSSDAYIFYNPSNGRMLIQNGDVKKVYRLEVNLFDE
jgi:hypothetical protein